MEQPPGISEFIVERPTAAAVGVASPTPQQFYPSPPAATVYVAQPRQGQAPGKPAASGASGGSAVLTALLIVLLVVAILYLVMQVWGKRPLAQALASCGWILYTRPGCGYCTKQMSALGVDSYPKQVVCVGGASSASGSMSDSQGPYLCKNVQAFPFWVNEYTQATRTGLQNRKQLEQMLRHPGGTA